jgi:hypothetical protein
MMKKRQPLQQILLGKLGIRIQKLNLDPCLLPCSDITYNWIKELNKRPGTFKELRKVVGNTLEHIGKDNNVLNRTPKAQQRRERMNKWDCIKLKSFCTAKESRQTQETVHRMGENLCQLLIW